MPGHDSLLNDNKIASGLLERYLILGTVWFILFHALRYRSENPLDLLVVSG